MRAWSGQPTPPTNPRTARSSLRRDSRRGWSSATSSGPGVQHERRDPDTGGSPGAEDPPPTGRRHAPGREQEEEQAHSEIPAARIHRVDPFHVHRRRRGRARSRSLAASRRPRPDDGRHALAGKSQPIGLCLRPAMRIPKTAKTVRIADTASAPRGCRFVPRRANPDAAPSPPRPVTQRVEPAGGPTVRCRVSSRLLERSAGHCPATVCRRRVPTARQLSRRRRQSVRHALQACPVAGGF